MKQRFRFFVTALLILIITPIMASAGVATLNDRHDVKKFIAQMVNQHGFDSANLNRIFYHTKIRPDILALMKRPKESSPWYKYQEFFLKPERINNGVVFWNQNQAVLAKVQKQYGVPASLIVAIIGVETNYGKLQGKYRAIDALSTFAFAYPSRAPFFRHELAEFLLLTREQHMNPLEVRGSYAGALGMCQFMPSSYRKYAVNADGNGAPDLIKNPNDAITSIANYFKNYGWQANQPIVIAATVTGTQYKKLLTKKIQPKYTIAQLEKKGVHLKTTLPKNTKASLIQLQGPKNNLYWLGFNNLYVITKYNGSINYAMAVNELAQKIQAVKLAKRTTAKQVAMAVK